MVTVYVGNVLTVISPDREFSLGSVNEDEEIVRDYDGARLVGVRVVKAQRFQ
jgi:hypothetical protein